MEHHFGIHQNMLHCFTIFPLLLVVNARDFIHTFEKMEI